MADQSNLWNNQKAMTIPEVIVSLAIISVTLLVIWQSFNLVYCSDNKANQEQDVLALADQVLNDFPKGHYLGTDHGEVVGSWSGYHYQLYYQLQDQYVLEEQWIQALVELKLHIKDTHNNQWDFYLIKEVILGE